uniref:Uncharacterized protein n=1 Tax=Trichogramma kaykai TaxID=54128 RepID=A0ABD2XFG5_9HYME
MANTEDDARRRRRRTQSAAARLIRVIVVRARERAFRIKVEEDGQPPAYGLSLAAARGDDGSAGSARRQGRAQLAHSAHPVRRAVGCDRHPGPQPRERRGVSRRAVRLAPDRQPQVHAARQLGALARGARRRQVQPGLPAETAQLDREDAQGPSRVLEEAPALSQESERGLPVSQHLRSCARYVYIH